MFSLGVGFTSYFMSTGGGLIGHGTEYYDSNPQIISFFKDMDRIVHDISAYGDLSMARSGREVYVWGHVGHHKNWIKALAPVLVKQALSLTQVDQIIAGVCLDLIS